MRGRFLAPSLALALLAGGCTAGGHEQPTPKPIPAISPSKEPLRPIAHCQAYIPAGWTSPWKFAAPVLANPTFPFTIAGIANALRVPQEDVATGTIGTVNCDPAILPEQAHNYGSIVDVSGVPAGVGSLCLAVQGLGSETDKAFRDVLVICPAPPPPPSSAGGMK